jgi:hypothetical protein
MPRSLYDPSKDFAPVTLAVVTLTVVAQPGMKERLEKLGYETVATSLEEAE